MAGPVAHIPAVYRVLFLWIDPLMALFGGCVPCLLMPAAFADNYLPKQTYKLNPLYNVFIYQIAAMFFSVAWVQGVLLRYTDDANVWRLVNAGLLGYDIILLYASYFAFTSQRRTNPSTWRPGDWFGVLTTVTIGTIRASIVAGIGIKG